jgi:dihydroflavonol-4-reductase
MTLAEILAQVADIVARRPPKVKLPHRLVMPAAYAAEAFARFSGRPPKVTVDGVRLAQKRMFFSHARADAELGYRARPAREALADAIAWYQAHGYLPAGRRPA